MEWTLLRAVYASGRNKPSDETTVYATPNAPWLRVEPVEACRRRRLHMKRHLATDRATAGRWHSERKRCSMAGTVSVLGARIKRVAGGLRQLRRARQIQIGVSTQSAG